MKIKLNLFIPLFLSVVFAAFSSCNKISSTFTSLPTTISYKAVQGSLNTDSIKSKVNHQEWNSLLQKHVSNNGKVDYKGFLKDEKQLEVYLNYLSENSPQDNWQVESQLAYYINLYNAGTVALILQNYPLQSIKDISNPWDQKFLKVGKEKLSLGQIEHSILRNMNEARIHFAINCASESCPKLLNTAFTANKIERQLEQVTREFIQSDKNNLDSEKSYLSKIFKWYKNDFLNGKVIEFIKPYTNKKLDDATKIRYKKYDWSLND